MCGCAQSNYRRRAEEKEQKRRKSNEVSGEIKKTSGERNQIFEKNLWENKTKENTTTNRTSSYHEHTLKYERNELL
jgi:hypothetical protein